MSSILFMSAADMSGSFRKLVNACFENVDGVLVEKTSTGFIVFGKQVATIEKVKDMIREAGLTGRLFIFKVLNYHSCYHPHGEREQYDREQIF